MSEIIEDVTRCSATRIAGGVQRGELSPVDLVRTHLDRIEATNAGLGAFQCIRRAQALQEAEALADLSDLQKLPLAGVPVAIKDCVDVAGEPTRHGSAASSPDPADADDELVRRLRAAGAIVVGKTTLPELAIWPFTESQAFGDTRNPWNTNHTPGGSSGGSAAAVANHMVPIALGSDGGGSIRIPAACCGIAGLKPAPGVLPLAGGLDEHWLGMSAYGPLARSIDDLALMYRVLRGADPENPQADAAPSTLRIALSTKASGAGVRVDGEVKTAVTRLGETLEGAGHRIVEADPPIPMDLALRFMRRWLPGIAEDAATMSYDALEPRTQSMVRVGRWIRRRGWDKSIAEDSFGVTMVQWLQDYDALLMPTLATTAAPVRNWRGKGWISTGLSVGNWICTNPWNVAGLPAASVPAGLAGDGLPIGAQLVAAPGGEELLISLMSQVEELAPWPMLGA